MAAWEDNEGAFHLNLEANVSEDFEDPATKVRLGVFEIDKFADDSFVHDDGKVECDE